MYYIKKIFFLLILLLVSNSCLFAMDNSTKQILVINSYHRGFVWSDDVIEGFENVIHQRTNQNVNVLYMDSKRINTKEYYDKLVELYKIQLKNQKYDLVIAIDKFAYDFVLEKYYELFTDEPVLFTGLERFNFKDIVERNLEDRIYGIIEKRAIEETIPMITTLVPNLKKLYIINDQSANGDDSLPFIEHMMELNKDKFSIELIRETTIEELNSLFSVSNKSEAVFFIRFYNNKYGNLYNNNEIASMIDSSKLPVFITDTLFINKGAVGGKLVLIKKLGELTGNVAMDILDKKIKAPYTTTLDEYEYMFDSKKTDEFGLSVNKLNEKITILNLPQTFFDKNRNFINFIFIISPVFFILIFGLLYNLSKRIDSEKKLLSIELEKNKHKQFIIQQSKLAEIGEVFSSIAHQWKNPLVEISTIAQEQAFYNGDKDSDKNDKYVKDIMVQVKYMNDTINNFQKFIMPSSEKIAFNVEEAIKSMMKIIDHTIKYNYIDIKIDKTKAKNTMVFGYKNEFMQTLLNIVNNAKDQIIDQRKKGTLKRGLIKFDIYNEKNNIVLEISDNGGGVKDHVLQHMFDAYFTTKKNGHGIGLYMSKLIIENKMGGKIKVYNKDNGLCFKITLGNIS